MPCGVRRGGVPEAEPYRTADALDRAVDLAKLRKGGFRDPSKTGAIPENDGLPELFERDIGFYRGALQKQMERRSNALRTIWKLPER